MSVRAWSALVACVLLYSCDARSTRTPHRLHGVWSPVDDFLVRQPTTDEDWKTILAAEDASYVQLIFLPDGTLVVGGLMLGHEVADESRWEIVEESPEQIRVRTTEANGRVDEISFHVVGPDRMSTGPNPPIMTLSRAPKIAPLPWLAKYEGRL